MISLHIQRRQWSAGKATIAPNDDDLKSKFRWVTMMSTFPWWTLGARYVFWVVDSFRIDADVGQKRICSISSIWECDTLLALLRIYVVPSRCTCAMAHAVTYEKVKTPSVEAQNARATTTWHLISGMFLVKMRRCTEEQKVAMRTTQGMVFQ